VCCCRCAAGLSRFRSPRPWFSSSPFLTFHKAPDRIAGGCRGADLQSRIPELGPLCSSEGTAKERFISEVAMREARPGHIILRASRMLAESDWNGRDYKLKMEGPARYSAIPRSGGSRCSSARPSAVSTFRGTISSFKLPCTIRAGDGLAFIPASSDSVTNPTAHVEVWRQTGVVRPAPSLPSK